MEQEPRNPHLADLFKTALAKAKTDEPEKPLIVVNGSHNVISWGGTVFMDPRAARPPTEAAS